MLLLVASSSAWGQSCTVNVTALAFGALESSDGIPVDSVSDISVDCDTPTPWLVRIDAGQYSSSFLPRIMRQIGGDGTLDYNLFSDAARTLIWGDGTGASSTVKGFSPGPGASVPVYGRIYGGQYPAAGSYVDSVTVTVEW